jgi:uncharacterized membrane protein YgaE (UPF0421/DUF939 family)
LTKLLTNVNWKHGLKTAIAAGICLGLVRVFKLEQGYWACVAAIVVMQSEAAATLTASRDRLAGTALGALLGWGAATVWNGHLIVYAVVILICIVIPEAIEMATAGRLAGVTATIILLAPSTAPHRTVALHRFLEVSFGIVVTLVVSQVLWRNTTKGTVPTVVR